MKGKRKFLEDPRWSKTKWLSNLSISQPIIVQKAPKQSITNNDTKIRWAVLRWLLKARDSKTEKVVRLFDITDNVKQKFISANISDVPQSHNITASWLRHINRWHWDNWTHIWKRAITKEDIRIIPDIIKNADNIEISNRLSNNWKIVVKYEKQIWNDIYHYREQYQWKKLKTLTMFID